MLNSFLGSNKNTEAVESLLAKCISILTCLGIYIPIAANATKQAAAIQTC